MEYLGGFGGGMGGGFTGFDQYGGGGDADMGGGGGFLDNAAGKSAEKRSRDNQSIMSVSIKQLVTADSDGENFRVDDVQLHQVKVIGFIESMVTHSTNQIYVIHDGSGAIECKAFIDRNDASGGLAGPREGEFR